MTRYDVDGLIFDDYFYPDGLPLGSGYDFNEYKRDVAPQKRGGEEDVAGRLAPRQCGTHYI